MIANIWIQLVFFGGSYYVSSFSCLQVFNTQEIRTALSHDANTFSMVNRDFRLLMKATEKNPNVLQCCQRKSK
jgi:hypothetical protein